MPIRILIADDNPSVRTALRHLLETTDHWEIIEAQDGREALAKAQEIRPNLIVLDLVMPVMDGLAAARDLTRLLPEIPLVMYTMHWSSQVQLEAQKAGARRVVAKTDSNGLVAAIHELLASEPSTPSVSALPPIPSSAMSSRNDPSVVDTLPAGEPAIIEPAIIESSLTGAGTVSASERPDSPAAEKVGDAAGTPTK
jgi:DNA-binding NarL/FixJ family response regulator